MKFTRLFTTPTPDVADQIKWKTLPSEILDSTGARIFYMPEVQVPDHWSQGATNILAQKYFRKAGVPNLTYHHENIEPNLPNWLRPSISTVSAEIGSETSAKQVFHRLAGAWTYWGWKEGIFKSQDRFEDTNAQIFYDEIYYMLAMQFAAPNSPQWFNTGLNWAYGITGDKSGQWAVDNTGQPYKTTDSYTNPQVHACYIQPVTDNLVESGGIFDLLRKEAIIFKHGSGTGTNFSNLRSKYETLSGGGKSSGMMSFLKIYDSAAGAIQSGGTTRRAAKLICIDLDHPEIEEFIDWKMNEEAKAAALRVGSEIIKHSTDEIIMSTHGHKNDDYSIDEARSYNIPEAMIDRARVGIETEICDLGFEGEAINTVSGQNANNSIRITDEFLQKVDSYSNWPLTARTTGKIVKVLKSEELWLKICTAAWACADPGLQFHDTINLWHTCKNDGRINASNPCSEYMFLDDTACNLASLNLGKFLINGEFDTKSFTHATRIWTTILEISVYMASFPSREIAQNSYLYRTLGLGYANAGGILMRLGLPYDSDKGRNLISGITALLHFQSYHTSQEMAKELDPFERWENNKTSMSEVIQMHMGKLSCVIADIKEKTMINSIIDKIMAIGGEIDSNAPFRNAQTTLVAPTGTIALLMDCGENTGIEPSFSLVVYKQLSGGGMMKIVNENVKEALHTLGYTTAQILSISQHITDHDTIEGWTVNGQPMPEEHLKVFDCAVPGGSGIRSLPPIAHVKMVAAVQPFLSGAVSKTVNMPNSATIADVDHIYREAHRLGLKAIAIYRDGSKLTQPLNTGQKKSKDETPNLTKQINEILNAHTKIVDPSPERSEGRVPRTEEFESIINLLAEGCNKIYEDETKVVEKRFDKFKSTSPLVETTVRGKRFRLPPRTTGFRQKYNVDGQSIYLHTGEYENGRLGEIFIEFSREGSLVRALSNSIGKVVSIGLQYGVPLSEFVDAFVFTKFEPSGIVHGHDRIKLCSSPLDLIFKDLAIHYLGMEEFANIEPPSPERSEGRVPDTEPTIGGTHLCAHGRMALICEICTPRVPNSEQKLEYLEPGVWIFRDLENPSILRDEYKNIIKEPLYCLLDKDQTMLCPRPGMTGCGRNCAPAPDSNTTQDSRIFLGHEQTTTTHTDYHSISIESSSKPLTTIRLKHGDACPACGHYPTIRTGTCITCPNCGSNSGCG